MKVPLLKTIILIAAVISFESAAVGADRSAKSDPNDPESLYEAGSELFNRYDSVDSQRIKGWEMMLKAAKAGNFHAKKDVAEFAAGFVSLNRSPNLPSFFKPNLPLALEYYRELVKRGDAESTVHLALLYSSGIGEPANESESPHTLLLSAAKKGNSYAMTLLAERYLYGYGEDKDLLEAGRWEYLASLNEHHISHWLDDQGEPRIQETPQQDEMAKLLSLFFKAGRLHDPVAAANLRSIYKAASKPLDLNEVFRSARPLTE
jgi:TPR repeat protein